jgi:hypothetical protein
MKLMSSKRLKYLVYMVSVIIAILVVFNIVLTFYIHKQLAQIVERPGKWPVGAYIYDEKIGFDFASNISGEISDGSYYVKSHELGYRIGQQEDGRAYDPGGLLSLGCSFTYGDEVESYQTFTQLAADSLGIPAYNYGICSFSYIHALLKAEELKEQGVLDKLKPKYVVLGCWNGLPDRSRTPFPPLASKTLPLPSAYIDKTANDVAIQYPIKLQHIFGMVELYREEGTGMSFKKFFKLFTAAPKYLFLYFKNNRMAKEWRTRAFEKNVSDYEVYDFYFSGIERIFADYNSKIVVLYMPNRQNEKPADGLVRALKAHPDIIFADGMQAIKDSGISFREYQGRHPQPPVHSAYAEAIVKVINDQ